MRGIPIADIKVVAQQRLDGILLRLAPGGRTAGGIYTVRNPTRADKNAGSFVVYMRGHMRGAFIEFADREREKGDVIDLVSYLLCRGGDFKGREARARALEWIADICGLAAMAPAEREAVKANAARFRRTAEEEATALAEKRKRAAEMWGDAHPLDQRGVAWEYLRHRGIKLSDIANRECDLREALQEYWVGAVRDTAGRKLSPGPCFPAMIAAMRDLHGIVQAVHVTFIAPDGSGKAAVPKPKLIWPEYSGCVIRLCKGAADVGPCIITEGIEDGLTEALGCGGEYRVWAAGALSNIANVPALPCVDGWMLVRQNDWHSRQALDQFERAKVALERTGRPVVEIATFGGSKDPNDLLRGK